MADLPTPLVSTDWLAANLDAPDLRVLDCTVYLHPLPGGDVRSESGRADYDKGHIPGAGFADLIRDLSDASSPLRFTLPSPAGFAAAMSRLGIGDGHRVVLYSGGSQAWGPRLWWMLRAFGFDRAAVLDGGWRKWTDEGRPVATAVPSWPPATFTARPRAGLFVGKDAVRAAMDEPGTCIVNALTPEQHAGTGGSGYGRPGRIPNSTNVSARDLLDPATGAFRPLPELRQRFAAAGTLDAGKVIAYCGGGIAASVDAMVLIMLGATDVAVYDASMQEWAKDPTLPMVRD
jgi:thiosulfate/3-mercaptopyruvate sulfurtransferase